jgi:hypothetical protein
MLVVIDLENTITNASDRMWLLKYEGKSEDMKEHYDNQFQEGFVDDHLNTNVKLFMDVLDKNHNNVIVILTAKLGKYRDLVVGWLEHYDVKYNELIMKCCDNISDIEFKEGYVKLNKDKIDFALDDVGANCAMFGKYNIPCLRIEQK